VTTALALAAVSVGVGVPTSAANGTAGVTLRAIGTPGTLVRGPGQFAAGGDTTLHIAVETLGGGAARIVPGPDSALPRALQLPSYVASGPYPRAVVSLTPLSGHGLSPGSSSFGFGAVYRLDATSSGRSLDDGDNVFQRGRYGDASIWKLQVDDGHPSCLVKGTGGQAFVRSPVTVTADRWYTTTCTRVGSTLRVEVGPYPGGTAVRTSVSAASGDVSFHSTPPASIGGKLSAGTGTTVARTGTDQLNGAVARVWVERL